MYVLIIFLKRSFLSKYVCSPQYFWRPVCKNISDQLVWNHEWLFLEKYLKWNEIFAWVTWVDMELHTNLPRVTIFPRGPYWALGGKWWPLGGWSAIPYPPSSPMQKLPISTPIIKQELERICRQSSSNEGPKWFQIGSTCHACSYMTQTKPLRS